MEKPHRALRGATDALRDGAEETHAVLLATPRARLAMQPLSVLLDRFRRAAVPAVVGGDVESELAPVFAALEEVQKEAEALRRRAETRAEERLELVRRETALLAAGWRDRADAERERLRADCRRRAPAETQAILAGARAEAERTAVRGRERIPDLLQVVLACVRAQGR